MQRPDNLIPGTISLMLSRFSRMWSVIRMLLPLLVFTLARPVLAANPEFLIGPAPSWVVAVSPDVGAGTQANQASNGVYYLLTDAQLRVGPHDQAWYGHYATQALNQSGVETAAHVSIDYDPAYQRLTLHQIQVRRGNQVISKLDAGVIKVLQREKQLEYRIYDGSKTVNAILDDIRVGDIVEYAYTIEGKNPVFNNLAFGQYDLQWSVPVGRAFARLVWPRDRDIRIYSLHTNLAPVIQETAGYRDYCWDARQVPALRVEENAPGWYNPYPRVQWSEFADWHAVANWAVPLYRNSASLDPALQSVVDRIAAAGKDEGQRLLAVLRFVQGEIRYLGLEIGAGSYAPSPPALVMQRRFGDCKDKSLLTVTLLQALGIRARPALVNTEAQRGIGAWQPMPTAFNHVIVQARIDGQDYWVDPTRLPQKGDLASLVQSDFGYALVIDAATQTLIPMGKSPASVLKRSVNAVFDAHAGIGEPVRFTVTSVLEGAGAEVQRSALANDSKEALLKQYMNYYARFYPSIESAGPLKVQEDEGANRLTMVEEYRIPGFWNYEKKGKQHVAEIHAAEILGYLRKPEEPLRAAPLRVIHPVDLTQVTEVRLPEDWSVKDERIAVDNPAFAFERKVAYHGGDRRILFTDHYRSLADQVDPAQMATYVADIDRVDQALGYSLYKYDQPAAASSGWLDRFNWLIAMLAVLLTGVWLWLARKLYRYDPPLSGAPVDLKLQGIRGWLILPAIGVTLQPVRILIDFSQTLSAYSTDTWAALTTPGGQSYHPAWAPLLLGELGFNLAMIVFSLLLVIMFYQKRRIVPRFYISLAIAGILIQLVDLTAAEQMPITMDQDHSKDWKKLFRSVLQAMIWGSYFLVSKRVKSTFLETCPASRRQQATVPATS